MHLRQGLAISVLMWVFLAQLALGSRHLSLTQDEPSHAMNGYVALVTADTWAMPDHTHPPLVNAWSALPLLLQPERPVPQTVPFWGQDFDRFLRSFVPLLGPVERLAFVTRYPIMLLALVLMALVYRWARDRSGHWGGILAAAVMAWDPTMIAHSQLDTTDLGLTLFVFACLYLVDRLLRRFRWPLLIAVGLALGAAMAAKPSGVIVVPVVAAILVWWPMRPREGTPKSGVPVLENARARPEDTPGEGRAWPEDTPGDGIPRLRDAKPAGSRLGGWIQHGSRCFRTSEGQTSPPGVCRLGYAAIVVVIGVLLVWTTYRFEMGRLPGVPLAVPLATHLGMIQHVLSDTSWSFVAGQRRLGAWWGYFPFVSLVKTPVPVMIGLAVALVLAARRRTGLASSATLWLFPTVYVVIAILGGMNIGYRHLLPVFPFAYVVIGGLAPWLWSLRGSRWRGVAWGVAAALGVWYVAGTWLVYPFGIAYFNELAGGPRGGYRYLADSNVDWGQSFKALKAAMDEAGIEEVNLAHTSWIDPAAYGVKYTPIPPAPDTGLAFDPRYDPPPGVYALGATALQGIRLSQPDLYDWFRHREPIAQPGYGLLVYQVSPRDPPAGWVAQCAAPSVPLTARMVRRGFGREDLRLIGFDCMHSWVYPDGGQSAGWYGLTRETWLGADRFVREHLSPARLSYQEAQAGRSPAVVLFEWPAANGLPFAGSETTARAAPAGWSPAQVETRAAALSGPIRFDGPLTFLGYRVVPVSEGDSRILELQTIWRVEATPTRPLSIMAHLVAPDGTALAVADGLGIPVDQLKPGDVVVQRHRLIVPEEAASSPYVLRTGVYWLEGTQLHQVAGEPGHNALFLFGPWQP